MKLVQILPCTFALEQSTSRVLTDTGSESASPPVEDSDIVSLIQHHSVDIPKTRL